MHLKEASLRKPHGRSLARARPRRCGPGAQMHEAGNASRRPARRGQARQISGRLAHSLDLPPAAAACALAVVRARLSWSDIPLQEENWGTQDSSLPSARLSIADRSSKARVRARIHGARFVAYIRHPGRITGTRWPHILWGSGGCGEDIAEVGRMQIAPANQWSGSASSACVHPRSDLGNAPISRQEPSNFPARDAALLSDPIVGPQSSGPPRSPQGPPPSALADAWRTSPTSARCPRSLPERRLRGIIGERLWTSLFLHHLLSPLLKGVEG